MQAVYWSDIKHQKLAFIEVSSKSCETFYLQGACSFPRLLLSLGVKVKEVMTPEEKQKLYNAIGYQENVDTVYPVEVRH